MKISQSEKLILALLCEIHQELGLDKKGGLDSKLISSALNTQNTWAIEQKYDGILWWNPEGEIPNDVAFVCNTLSMWRFIEISYNKLSSEEKFELKEKTHAFGNDITFNGFDGYSESKFISIAKFYINEMHVFSEFSGRTLSTHSPRATTYQRMLSNFKPIKDEMLHSSSNTLSIEQLIMILKA
ncbi:MULTISPECIES: YfbU family protein [Proteus]|uniref:YfbU family protein n=1 Tax=Proteus TaxID=583 RepID=UPI001FAE4C29|nr:MULTISPECIES: YfbU family protein [Proteus]MCI9742605.1 YfbU family protein [Proteus mirabilis]MCI9800369.1 YfbU family protein [Proteus mirabilis]MCI9811925.1 YfbU family protein [Proteus mirabilis]UXA34238.1 YfbU family protein [Proteus terrae]